MDKFHSKSKSKKKPVMTITGYTPIIQVPAHDLDKLNTAVMRCKRIARKLGQLFAVTTVEQALFYKLIRLLKSAN